MADRKDELPEGTDKVIVGASNPSPDAAATENTLIRDTNVETLPPGGDSGTGGGRLADRLRNSTGKLSSEAGNKARGLVSQGLERGSEALANVGKLVGDTATGLDERLGEEYGDYARRAAGAIEGAANSLASKDPDELIDDTRNFVRQSPGVALAGAAIIGFALARLVKSGLGGGERDRDRSGS